MTQKENKVVDVQGLTTTKYANYIEKCIEADKKRIAEEMEFSRVHCPEVYERIQEVKAEAEEIAKKEGLAAALKFIVDSKFKKED